MTARRLPVTYHSGEQSFQGRSAVVEASDADVATFGNQRAVTCGSCRFFELRHGQKKMQDERFPERLVREEGWKTYHVGAPMEQWGLCGMSGGQMVTTHVTNASSCDQYRPKR